MAGATVAIIGGGGFIGQKLAQSLAKRGTLRDHPIEKLILADLAAPTAPEAPFAIHTLAMDISDADAVARAIPDATDIVFHLAAIVSGQAEAEFDTGMRVNLAGTQTVLERCRALPRPPVVVFSSSLAVFGGDVPEPITDHSLLNPQTSYGAQKAMGELLVTDYSRKGFIDGRGIRLPTVSIRPGRPNAAASSFMSSIFREPLQGEEAVCPVAADYAAWISSPRVTVANVIHAAEIDGAALGPDRCLTLPGLSVTMGDAVEAMRRVAGEMPVRRIRWEPDARIQSIVSGWKARFTPTRALALGFQQDRSFEDNVRWFLEDDAQILA